MLGGKKNKTHGGVIFAFHFAQLSTKVVSQKFTSLYPTRLLLAHNHRTHHQKHASDKIQKVESSLEPENANVNQTQCSLKTNEIRLVLHYIHAYYSAVDILFLVVFIFASKAKSLLMSRLTCPLDRR